VHFLGFERFLEDFVAAADQRFPISPPLAPSI